MRRALAIALALSACSDDAAGAAPTPAPASAPAKDEGGGANDAIDPFTEYQRKSKTSEARVMTNRIATSARIAFEEERVVDGAVVAHGLPPSAPLTPEAGACCKQPKGKCAAGFAKWDHPAWQALTFVIDDPHYYSYEFESSPDGFVARAVGDLDCDGKLSTFEVRGKIAGEELVVEPIVVENELE